MAISIRRRELVLALGGVAATWPLAARAQQPEIGFLNGASAQAYASLADTFRQGLGSAGFVEGRNVLIEYRWAEGHYERLAILADDLVRRPVAVIFANGPAVVAAKKATTTIPIVFATGLDPIASGLVSSLSQPSGNVTGFTSRLDEAYAKPVELLHDLLPAVTTFGALLNPGYPSAEAESKNLQEAARTLGLQLSVLHAAAESQIDASFATFAQEGIRGLFVETADPFFAARRSQIIALAAHYAIPTVYNRAEFAKAGGLMGYGASVANTYRQAGIYVGRIVKGEKVANLPVQQSTKVDFFVNLKTAKTLGLTIPTAILVSADEVIE
jgi:putative tryptophan/tyrosine transport system substrate-binding protein